MSRHLSPINKNTAHRMTVLWTASERNALMSKVILPNDDNVPQPESETLLEVYYGQPRDYAHHSALVQSTQLPYPSEPTFAIRNSFLTGFVSGDGQCFLNCPRCHHPSRELCLEPIAITKQLQQQATAFGDYTGMEIGLGIHCCSCGFIDRMNLRGWIREECLPGRGGDI